jgi:hypothetical protein
VCGGCESELLGLCDDDGGQVWMNEWMSEWMNGWMNEWVDDDVIWCPLDEWFDMIWCPMDGWMIWARE